MQQHPRAPYTAFWRPDGDVWCRRNAAEPHFRKIFLAVIFERVLTSEKWLLRVATGLGEGSGEPSYKHRAPGRPTAGFQPVLDIAIYDRGGAIRPPNNSSYQRK